MKSSGNELANAITDSTTEKLIHVLYVDDEAGLLKAAKPILEMMGSFRVETALSVKQAMQKMKEKAFDAIVSDYQMPEEDGLDFLKKLRNEGNNIPFILFTGKGREEVAIEALNLGADRYFNKVGRPEAVYGELAHGILSVVRARSAEEKSITFKAIADKAGYGVLLVDFEGNTLYANEACAKMHGYAVDELVGENHSILHKKNVAGCVTRAKKDVLEKGYVIMEEQHLKKDGTFLPVLVNAAVIKDAEDSPLYLVAVITDLTERLVTLEKLQRKTADLSLINSINDALNRSDSLQDVIRLLSNETKKLFAGSGATVYLLSEDKQFLVMQNLAISQARREKIEKLIGAKIPQITLPLEPDSLYYQVLQKNEPQIINDPKIIQGLTLEFIKTVNLTKKFSSLLKPLMSQINRVLGIKSVMIVPLVSDGDTIGLVDISSKRVFTESDLERFNAVLKPLTVAIKRRQTEEQLKESEEKFRSMIEQAPDLIVTIDEKGIVTSCNSTLESETGYSQPEIVGKHFIESPLLHGVDPAYAQKLFKAIIEEKHPDSFELTWFLKDGTPRISEVRIGVMKKDGKIAGFTAVARDITEQKTSEEALRESEEKFRNLADQSPNMIFINKKGRVVYANKQCEHIMGYTTEELQSPDFNFFTLIAPDSIEVLKSIYSRHLKGEEILPYEYALVTKDGKRIEAILTSKLINYGGEKAILGIITDITERKQIEKQLKDSAEKYRELLNGMNDTAWVIDSDCSFIDVNDSAVKTLGYSREELLSMKIFDIDFTLDPKEIAALVKGMPKDEVQVFQTAHTAKDGKTIPVEISSSLVTYRGKQTVLSIARNITERKRMEKALWESEERFRQVAENSGEWIWEVDANGLYTYASPVVENMLGYTPEELVGKKRFHDMFHPEDREKLEKAAFQCFAEKKPFHEFLNRVVHKNGKTVWLSTSGVPILDDNGNLLGYRGSDTDVTKRKDIEEHLKESEERYRKQFEMSLDAKILAEAETGIIVDCNPAATKLFGRKKSELVGKHQRILHPPETIEGEFTKGFKQHRKEKGGQVLEEKIVTKNGDIRDVLVNATAFELGGKTFLQGTFHDITDSKKAEAVLRESERRFRELSELLPEVVFETDATGLLTFVNKAAFERFGYSKKDFDKGLNALQMVAPEDREKAKENIEKVLQGNEIGPSEYMGLKKDGSRFPFIINSTPIFRENKPAGLRGLVINITERKKAEQKLEGMMNQVVTINEKLGVVGRLTRHDARNKLSVIANNVYLAKQKLAANHGALEYLGDIESAIDQIEELFEFAKTYEMLGVEELSYIDVKKSFDEAAMLFSGLKCMKLVNECQGLTVTADSLLRKVFYNLIDDTLKHAGKVSQIRVYCEAGKDWLKLVYEDDGVGVPNHEKEKIFEEGYGKGTGYGLYLIKKICEEYGWTIHETGTPKKGAQFTMVIPKMTKKGKMSYVIN